eukprot:TRINITY_DN14971_c0_g1_i1.p1 TRINITY_DN14971_c0_g1~~TRINITY_DN14971_c0_g1_i1.p1  ORF type:complete len:343 (+),score=58.78 TRINITY_DN14971_c0_g1_i1:165-1193(+)
MLRIFVRSVRVRQARPCQPQKRTIFGWGSSKETPPAQAPPPKPPQTPPAAKPGSQSAVGGSGAVKEPTSKVINNKPTIPGVKHIVAVASGKGGVGKSTVAVNLAMALMQHDLRVGLLDADIYGPSIPLMLNLEGIKPQVNENKMLVPLQNFGVKCMSMGFLVPADAPTIWRGPMVMGAIDQMLRQVEWGDLDIMVVDLPPGTGDAQLTLTQRAPLSGAVIVSTPQDVALIDTRRGLNMFKTVNVPILGVVENMSYFECPCGQQFDIFGRGGAKKTAEKMGADFLGEIPIVKEIREYSDQGKPITVALPDSSTAKSYRSIAQQVIQKLESQKNQAAGPTIIME